MGHACELHSGRVVKNLGDGVLAVFARESDAVDAMVDMMRQHRTRTAPWPPGMRMQIKVGMASGEIVQVDDDCYGEAVTFTAACVAWPVRARSGPPAPWWRRCSRPPPCAFARWGRSAFVGLGRASGGLPRSTGTRATPPT